MRVLEIYYGVIQIRLLLMNIETKTRLDTVDALSELLRDSEPRLLFTENGLAFFNSSQIITVPFWWNQQYFTDDFSDPFLLDSVSNYKDAFLGLAFHQKIKVSIAGSSIADIRDSVYPMCRHFFSGKENRGIFEELGLPSAVEISTSVALLAPEMVTCLFHERNVDYDHSVIVRDIDSFV
jgi:hypothetical protein